MPEARQPTRWRRSLPNGWSAAYGGPAALSVASCDAGHGAARGGVLKQTEGWGPGVFKTSYHQRPHELRLAISSEAHVLFSDFGDEAHAEACRRASEASNDSREDWSVVAATMARRSGRALIRARRLIRLNRRAGNRLCNAHPDPRRRRGVGSGTQLPQSRGPNAQG
jgi:hypothetical protein